MSRCIGLDLHREFAPVAVWQDGLGCQAGRIAMTVEALGVFADSLAPSDEVAPEATGNTFPRIHPVIRRPRSDDTKPQAAGPGRASPVPVAAIRTFRALYVGESVGPRSRLFTPSMAFALRDWARPFLSPAEAGFRYDAAGCA